MSKQISSVDWLIKELGEYFPSGIGGIELMVKQAKERHRQEIEDAHNQGRKDKEYKFSRVGKDYYTQTFEQ
jgi:hypothetical protein